LTQSSLPLEGIGIMQPWINYLFMGVSLLILIVWFFKSGLRTMFSGDFGDR